MQALAALRALWASMERTGSSWQSQGNDPDLMVRGNNDWPLLLYVTKAKGPGHPLLVTLSVDDFLTIAASGISQCNTVLVGVKGRSQTWLDSLYRGLVGWAKKNGYRWM